MNAFQPTCRLGALAAAIALLVACGGGDDTSPTAPTEPTALSVGDRYSVEVQVGNQPASSEHFRVYGITQAFDLVTTDTGKLIPGALVPLPDATGGKQTTASAAEAAAEMNALMEKIKALLEAQRDLDQVRSTTVPIRQRASAEADLAYGTVLELADLDTDVRAIVADLVRSRLTPAQYVAFFQALDEVPHFAAMDDAEGQLIAFFDGVEEAEQKASCNNINNPGCKGPQFLPFEETAESSWDTAAVAPGQTELLAALSARGLSWRDFLDTMATRGEHFDHLQLRYQAWAATRSPVQAGNPFQPFLADYLADATATESAQREAPRNAAGAGAVIQGIGSLLSTGWDIIKSSRPVVDAASTQNFVLATDDNNPMHYANAKPGHTDTITVKFTSPGVTWAEAQFSLDGYFNADHATLPGRWMPQLNFEVEKASAKPSISLNVRANVTAVVNVGTHAAPMPQADVRVDVTQGSLFNSKLKKVWFRAHGADGFSVTKQE